MADPYIGDIRMFGGNFAPVGWAFCDGSLLSIGDYATLFQLIGTTYGGDGQSTFGLPNLLGRVPIHANGSSYAPGASGGSEQVTLTTPQLPPHNHQLAATTSGANTTNPSGALLAAGNTVYLTTSSNPTHQLASGAVGQTGSNVAHDNMMPFQAVNYIIATDGVYPPQN